MDESRVNELQQEGELAACHEAAHVVINAAKGRLSQDTRIWFDTKRQVWTGFTTPHTYREGPPNNDSINEMLGIFSQGAVDRAARVNPITPASPFVDQEQVDDKMPLESELPALAAGIEAEIKRAGENGWDNWSEESIRLRAQQEDDYRIMGELIRKAGKEVEKEALVDRAYEEARELLAQEEIWALVIEVKDQIIAKYSTQPELAEINPLQWAAFDEKTKAKLIDLFTQTVTDLD